LALVLLSAGGLAVSSFSLAGAPHVDDENRKSRWRPAGAPGGRAGRRGAGRFSGKLGVWAQPAGARIVLDCAELAYASSEGLALLVQGPPGHPRFFGVAGLNRRISGTIELLGMDKRLNRFASVEQALAAAAS
jgi:anti-anti-sigma regulatory factor